MPNLYIAYTKNCVYIGIGIGSVSADMKKILSVIYRIGRFKKWNLSVLIGIGRYEKKLIGRTLRGSRLPGKQIAGEADHRGSRLQGSRSPGRGWGANAGWIARWRLATLNKAYYVIGRIAGVDCRRSWSPGKPITGEVNLRRSWSSGGGGNCRVDSYVETGYTKQSVLCHWVDRWVDCRGSWSPGKSIAGEAYHRGSRSPGKLIPGEADRQGNWSPEKPIVGEANRQGSRLQGEANCQRSPNVSF